MLIKRSSRKTLPFHLKLMTLFLWQWRQLQSCLTYSDMRFCLTWHWGHRWRCQNLGKFYWSFETEIRTEKFIETVIIIIIMEASLFQFPDETQQKKLFSSSCFTLRLRQGLSNSCSKMSVSLQNLNGKEDILFYMDEMCSHHSTPSFVRVLNTFPPTLLVQKSYKCERELSRISEGDKPNQ